ncbi:MAG: iron ABC transporter permease [Candidatus Hydrogenedentes bacterium]|nr:iron ABC transporter permease [Candidatus Hydrogenedentota bacterium]
MLFLICVFALGLTVLYPTARLAVSAAAHWQSKAIFDPSAAGFRATLNTIFISLASVGAAGIAGTSLALLLSRYSFRGRNLAAAMAYLPFALPPLVGVLSFYYIIGRDGFVPRILEAWLGRPHLTLTGPWAILLIHTYSFYVFFFSMVSSSLDDLDLSLIEAARTLGASRRRVFLTVTLPLLKPALLGAALLTFMSSGASFSAPYFFGADFPMLSVQIFDARGQNQEGAALTLTVVLACVSLLGIALFRSRASSRGAASKGVRRPPKSRAGRYVLTLFAWTVVALLLIPHLTILWLSFVNHNQWHSEVLPRILTVGNYAAIFHDAREFVPIRNSLWTSGLATVMTLLVSIPAAYLIGRKKRGAGFVNFLVMIPWALPGTVIAVNLITAFNDRWAPLYNTVWMLPLAYFVRNVPLVTRMAAAAIEPFDAGLIAAGRTLGASNTYCFTHITLPLLTPAIAAAAMLAFATGLGEFVASILLYVPANLPISMKIFEESRGNGVGSAFAYAVLLMLLVSGAFLLSRRFASRVL